MMARHGSEEGAGWKTSGNVRVTREEGARAP